MCVCVFGGGGGGGGGQNEFYTLVLAEHIIEGEPWNKNASLLKLASLRV